MTGEELIRLIQSLQAESCPVFSVAQGYLSLVGDENISVIGNSLFLGHVEFDKRNLQAYFEEFYELVSETEAEAIFNDGKEVFLLVERNGRERELSVLPVFSAADGSYKIGAWIRDSIQGIGTVTYIDPNSGTFGALGHGVYDADTDLLMDIRGGSLTEAELTGIVKGQKGKAGELTGKIELQEKIGVVEENTETGIFGTAEELFSAGADRYLLRHETADKKHCLC